MKKLVIFLVLLILLLPSTFVVALVCGDGICEAVEENHWSNKNCPVDCEGDLGGSCFDSSDCEAGLECVEKECVTLGNAGGIVSQVAQNIIKSQGAPGQEGLTQDFNSSQKLLARIDDSALIYNQFDKSYTLTVYGQELELKKLEDIEYWTEEFIIRNSLLTVYPKEGEGLSSQRMVLKKINQQEYEIKTDLNGTLQTVAVQNLGVYGVAIASIGDIPIYTLKVQPNLQLIIGPYLLTIHLEGLEVHFVDTEVSECSDGYDNEGDGFVDYNGICEADKQKYVCWCDYDFSGDDSKEEYVSEDFCGNDLDGDGIVDEFSYDYFCRNKGSGEIKTQTCSELRGEYKWYDESCIDKESTEGDTSCVSQNVVEMGIVCSDIYGVDPELCLELYPSDMEVLCQGDLQSCVAPEDCSKGTICDSEFLVCVEAEKKVAQNLALGKEVSFCVTNAECNTRTQVCQEGICVEDLTKLGFITYDNPFLGFMAKTVDNIKLNINNENFQKNFMKKQVIQNVILEKKKETGQGSKSFIEKAQEKTVKNMATSIEKQNVIIAKKLEQNPNSSQAKVAAMKLSINSATVGKVSAKSLQVKRLTQILEQTSKKLEAFVPEKVKIKLDNSKSVAEGKVQPKVLQYVGKPQQFQQESSLPPGIQAQIQGRISLDGKVVPAGKVSQNKINNFQPDKVKQIRRGDIQGNLSGEFVPKQVQQKLKQGQSQQFNRSVNQQAGQTDEVKKKLEIGLSNQQQGLREPQFQEGKNQSAQQSSLVGVRQLGKNQLTQKSRTKPETKLKGGQSSKTKNPNSQNQATPAPRKFPLNGNVILEVPSKIAKSFWDFLFLFEE